MSIASRVLTNYGRGEMPTRLKNYVEKNFRVSEHVKWNHAGNTAEGQIKQAFTKMVTRKIKGHEVTRNATDDVPAYLIGFAKTTLSLPRIQILGKAQLEKRSPDLVVCH